MATDSNSTTTLPTSDSHSVPASTNTTSIDFSTSTTSSPTSRTTTTTTSTTDATAGRPSDVWSTSTVTFVTVAAGHSTPTTSTFTTVVQISGPRSSVTSSFRQPLSSADPSTQSTTEIITEGLPESESSSSPIPDASKSQRRLPVSVVVGIGLVVALFIAGIFFLLFCRRRRRRRRQKEMEHISQRTESCSSFLDTDPFVCVRQNLTSMRSVGVEDQRGITQPSLDTSMTSNWWDSVDKEAFVFRKPKSLGNDNPATLPSRHDPQRSSPDLQSTYPSILFEQDAIIGEGGQSLERRATLQSLDEPPMLLPISHHFPRPPRSLHLKSNRSTRHSFDSVSTAHSSSASLLSRPSPQSRLDELFYHGTTTLDKARCNI